MGLGSLDSIGLAKARQLATEYRELIATGIDPIEQRNQSRAQAAAIQPVPSFDEVAKTYITAHRPSWRNPIHAKQWETTLKTYASPVIGKLPVNAINTDHVMRVLGADLARENRHREAGAGQNRNRVELCDRAKVPAWRQSGTVDRLSFRTIGATVAARAGQASCRAGLQDDG